MSFIKKARIVNDYKISDQVLGIGLNGKVLRCTHRETNQVYALKILEDTPGARREAELHRRVSDCPYVVKIIDVYEDVDENKKKKYLLLVMECMEGGELFDRIKSRTRFTESEAANIVFQIASAICHLHNNSIAHRDLKPENLLFASKDPNSYLKLTDFGFAKEIKGPNSLITPVYTPYYVAPEILTESNYDKSCDLWSLGIITYILLCGFPPFYSKNNDPISPRMKENIKCGNYDFPQSHWANISKEAIDLIRRLLLTEPTERLSCTEVMQHPWVAQHTSVPATPLNTSRYLSDAMWTHVNEAMNEELRGMRTDTEGTPLLLPIEIANNPLLAKRNNRNKTSN